MHWRESYFLERFYVVNTILILSWHDLLLLQNGQTIHLPATKSQFSKDIIVFESNPALFCKRQDNFLRGGALNKQGTFIWIACCVGSNQWFPQCFTIKCIFNLLIKTDTLWLFKCTTCLSVVNFQHVGREIINRRFKYLLINIFEGFMQVLRS